MHTTTKSKTKLAFGYIKPQRHTYVIRDSNGSTHLVTGSLATLVRDVRVRLGDLMHLELITRAEFNEQVSKATSVINQARADAAKLSLPSARPGRPPLFVLDPHDVITKLPDYVPPHVVAQVEPPPRPPEPRADGKRDYVRRGLECRVVGLTPEQQRVARREYNRLYGIERRAQQKALRDMKANVEGAPTQTDK